MYTLRCQAERLSDNRSVTDPHTGQIEQGVPGDYLCTSVDGQEWIEKGAFFEAHYLSDEKPSDDEKLAILNSRSNKVAARSRKSSKTKR